jgi:outer membrane usher protein
LTGSNDLEVRVRDVSGFQQSIAYRSYLDPIDLAPGDYEFAAYAGKISREFGRSPKYNGPLAFTGFFRKAFIDAPAIGVGLQLSKNAQIASGQTQFVLDGGSRLSFDLSASRARGYGFGYAPGVTFDHIFERNGLTDSLTLHAEHTSRRFASLATDNPDNGSKLSLDAQYARAISRTVTLLVGGTYSMNRGGFGNTYRINAIASIAAGACAPASIIPIMAGVSAATGASASTSRWCSSQAMPIAPKCFMKASATRRRSVMSTPPMAA